MIKSKDLKQGKTIWIVRPDTDALVQRSECVFVAIPYLVMSKNYIRSPSYTPDRMMNINTASTLIDAQDPLRYGIFLSRRSASSFQKKVTNHWMNQVYAQ